MPFTDICKLKEYVIYMSTTHFGWASHPILVSFRTEMMSLRLKPQRLRPCHSCNGISNSNLKMNSREGRINKENLSCLDGVFFWKFCEVDS